MASADRRLNFFSTCPSSILAEPATCRRQLNDIARWSEEAGCEGLLVSGSSPAGMDAARLLGATPVEYPKPLASDAFSLG